MSTRPPLAGLADSRMPPPTSRASSRARRSTSRSTSPSVLGVPVHLKLENLQRTGSFKIRGATYRLSRLTAEERARGVVAASAGNHAQGVALAAKALGIPATIFMPLGVPGPEAARDARLRRRRRARRGDRRDAAAPGRRVRRAHGRGASSTPSTTATSSSGQGTLGLELFDEVPDLDTVVLGHRRRRPHRRRRRRRQGARGRRRAHRADHRRAGRELRRLPVVARRRVTRSRSRPGPTIADGIAVARPGDLPFEIIRELVDEVVTVTEDDIARALLVLLERAKQVVEPAGAVGRGRDPRRQGHRRPVRPSRCCPGGNIDPLLLQRVVSHGLAASGRYMTLRIPLPDRPGQLARVSELLAQAGANVIEVLHTRHGQGLQISEVILQLSVETRGEEHRAHVIADARRSGIRADRRPRLIRPPARATDRHH